MEVIALSSYVNWLTGLKNRKDALRISARILRIEQNNFGDTKSVGGGVSELRFTFGPGYRVYYTLREGTVCILLGGGTKQRQQKDIATAKDLAARL
jgi:putative addiction module killer protein